MHGKKSKQQYIGIKAHTAARKTSGECGAFYFNSNKSSELIPKVDKKGKRIINKSIRPSFSNMVSHCGNDTCRAQHLEAEAEEVRQSSIIWEKAGTKGCETGQVPQATKK